ncbi:hypothetical protein ABS71_13525 [bacterium SCN 62-11]|nr:hypothetical protein [Candidatus Eremiobacteraeota bacterium]ODT64131.1 MAG: hypothetical protein ABS71_13525 [bacterium SCN 62-11]
MNKKWLSALLLGNLLSLAACAQQLDSDGDGLPDDWETRGVTVGGVFLDLPAMGADPLHKDLFVQVDYMVGSDHTHQPKTESLKQIVDCFAFAPVSNPDGRYGINIHIDAGPDTIMSGTKTWDSLSRAKELPHVDFFGAVTSQGWPDFASVDQVKATNLPPERLGVFRYCLYIHQITGQGGTSGYARNIPSDDFIVSLGAWSAKEGTVVQQSGTFVHELGHTLGLRHGGPNHVHRKPNYLSVMNYLYQTRGLRYNSRDGLVDFSRYATATLDEYNLNETLGITGAPANYGARWLSKDSNGTLRDNLVNFASRAIDWNGDGVISNDVAHDINNDGREELLATQNDWTSIVYAAGSVGQAPIKKVEPEPLEGELDLTTDEQLSTEYAVSVDSLGDASADPGGSANLHFTVSNQGSLPDSYTLSGESEHHWTVTTSPTTLNLAPGASQDVQVTVQVPAGAASGLEEEVELLARSGDLVDSDVEDVVVAGAIPDVNGSGSGFSGGSSGCFVATAAYGSYLDPHVVTLRNFRDQCLMPVAPGLVQAYYQHSPPLARAVVRHSWLKAGALAVLTPLVLVLEHPIAALLLLLTILTQLRRRRRARG